MMMPMFAAVVGTIRITANFFPMLDGSRLGLIMGRVLSPTGQGQYHQRGKCQNQSLHGIPFIVCWLIFSANLQHKPCSQPEVSR
jgi:hypothetical protein